MREIERIERMTELIKEIWKLQPDMRFTQLIHSITSVYNIEQDGKLQKEYYEKEENNIITSYRKTSIIDGFYLEDDDFEKFLVTYLEEAKEIIEWFNELGEEYFNTPKENFVKLLKNMSGKEYREWRKGNKN